MSSPVIERAERATLPLSEIREDGGTQARVQIDSEAVRDYADALNDGAALPPVVVFYDGSDYWLADGFHRLAAARSAEREQIEAEVRRGTKRDAVLHAVGANTTHGLRRSNADKRKAVRLLLEDEEWGKWSDREIAAKAGVSHPFVAKQRCLTGNVASERTYTTKHGTRSTMNTENVGATETERDPTPEVIEPPLRPGFGGDGSTLDVVLPPHDEQELETLAVGNREPEEVRVASDRVARAEAIMAEALAALDRLGVSVFRRFGASHKGCLNGRLDQLEYEAAER